MLELIRQSIIEVVQNEPYAPIYIKAKSITENAPFIELAEVITE
ncbi:MAG TPA: hypothetical protein VJL60_00375 [Gammaproteobacteria bacterium]|nr:hypothetical protein [Gammaproteobacteria bacterium]